MTIQALDSSLGERYALYNGDCIDVMAQMPDSSVGYSIFSPPFASLYTYSNSDRDLGNCRSDEDFLAHFGFVLDQLFRLIKPGRLLSMHCMDMQCSKTTHGFIGAWDFPGALIAAAERAGFRFHSRVCVWKDPVTAMQRTKAIGLLWKQVKKDAALSRQGFADYIVTLRKPGENAEPIAHDPAAMPVALWQRYASPVWMDIAQGETLQYRAARDGNDERHIAPLQLEVIRRCIDLWSNVGDVVLSPFAGIGSEPWVAVEMGRYGLGIELKPSYFAQAARNMASAGARGDGLLDALSAASDDAADSASDEAPDSAPGDREEAA